MELKNKENTLEIQRTRNGYILKHYESDSEGDYLELVNVLEEKEEIFNDDDENRKAEVETFKRLAEAVLEWVGYNHDSYAMNNLRIKTNYFGKNKELKKEDINIKDIDWEDRERLKLLGGWEEEEYVKDPKTGELVTKNIRYKIVREN